MTDMKSISVYCASSTQIGKRYAEAAYQLGVLMAQHQLRLIYGGGDRGLMGAVVQGVLENGGEAYGVIPHFMVEAGWHHRALTRLIEVEDMSSRKKLMEEISDGCIALPGGVGTFDELMEVISLKKLGLYLKPVAILNTDGFYESLRQLLQHSIDEHFMHPGNAELWNFVNTPQEAVDFMIHTPLADVEHIRKMTAI